jgi:hypothetical protein
VAAEVVQAVAAAVVAAVVQVAAVVAADRLIDIYFVEIKLNDMRGAVLRPPF